MVHPPQLFDDIPPATHIILRNGEFLGPHGDQIWEMLVSAIRHSAESRPLVIITNPGQTEFCHQKLTHLLEKKAEDLHLQIDWLYHCSETPFPGDIIYCHMKSGRNPTILARDGYITVFQVRSMLNEDLRATLGPVTDID